MPQTPGLWEHATQPIAFTLIVDDYGIKYTNKSSGDHSIQCLLIHYELTMNWDGAFYCGIKLIWYYVN